MGNQMCTQPANVDLTIQATVNDSQIEKHNKRNEHLLNYYVQRQWNYNIQYQNSSDSLKYQRDLQIGPFIDKSQSESRLKTLQIWVKHIDKFVSQVDDVKKSAVDIQYKNSFFEIDTSEKQALLETQKAMSKFYTQDPERFEQILSSQGGGILRWQAWKCKLLNQITNKPEYVEFKFSDIQFRSEIGKDIQRTFPNIKCFTTQEQLYNLSFVLNQICCVFPSLSYCQGMNYMLAFLLINTGGNCDETWKGIFPMLYSYHWMVYGIYMLEFPLLQILQLQTSNLLEKKDPQLFQKMLDLHVDDSYLINKWILTFYLYNLPFQVVLHLWDIIVGKGIWYIAQINVELLISLKNQIMKCNQDSDFMFLVQQISGTDNIYFKNYHQIVKTINSSDKEIDRKEIMEYAEKVKLKLKDQDALVFINCFKYFYDEQLFKVKYEQFIEERMIVFI